MKDGNLSIINAHLDGTEPFVVPERVVEAHVDPDAFRNINKPEDLAAIRGHGDHGPRVDH